MLDYDTVLLVNHMFSISHDPMSQMRSIMVGETKIKTTKHERTERNHVKVVISKICLIGLKSRNMIRKSGKNSEN